MNTLPARKRRVAVCVAGWHFPPEFYVRLSGLPAEAVFVVSHKPRQDVPPDVFERVGESRIIFAANSGYDWGCYQQFLERGLWRHFDYLFFMHDDVDLKSPALIDAAIGLMDQGYSMVGNGRISSKRDWPRTHLSCYAHSTWVPPSSAFEHDAVRGSFLATTRSVLEKLGEFEVFWDRWHLHIRFGNWSLISTCGKVQHLFGDKAFAFLSEGYRESPFLVEHERGGNPSGEREPQLAGIPALRAFLLLCEAHVRARMAGSDAGRLRFAMRKLVIRMVGGR